MEHGSAVGAAERQAVVSVSPPRLIKLTTRFRQTELIYLSVSSAVDVTLSAALCSEMWWARKKLAPERGMMREVVTRVMVRLLHARRECD